MPQHDSQDTPQRLVWSSPVLRELSIKGTQAGATNAVAETFLTNASVIS